VYNVDPELLPQPEPLLEVKVKVVINPGPDDGPEPVEVA
jgi:hypothetical protein